MRHSEPAPLRRRAHFFQAFEDLGATYLQIRTYQRRAARLTSASNWGAGGGRHSYCAERVTWKRRVQLHLFRMQSAARSDSRKPDALPVLRVENGQSPG